MHGSSKILPLTWYCSEFYYLSFAYIYTHLCLHQKYVILKRRNTEAFPKTTRL
jgi:hypothetical protein